MREALSTRGTSVPRRSAEIHRVTPIEAAASWRQLLRGDWVMLDRVDDGHGRRFVLARFAGYEDKAWHRLSEREKSVVAAIAHGRSNREIAGALGISVSTVAGHLRTARRKLGGARRLDLVRLWGSSVGHPSVDEKSE